MLKLNMDCARPPWLKFFFSCTIEKILNGYTVLENKKYKIATVKHNKSSKQT